MWQDGCVVCGWSDLLKGLHIPHQAEPKGQYFNNEDRPDISAKRASEEKGHVAEKREQRKVLKYKIHQQGVPKFVPLVFKHFGNWGSEADKFLKEISKISADNEGRSNEHEFIFQYYYRNVIVRSF